MYDYSPVVRLGGDISILPSRPLPLILHLPLVSDSNLSVVPLLRLADWITSDGWDRTAFSDWVGSSSSFFPDFYIP